MMQNVCLRINEDRDLIRLQRGLNLFAFHQPCRYIFNCVHALVHRICKRDCTTDGERLREFSDSHLESRMMQAKRDARGQVTSASDKDPFIVEHWRVAWMRFD